MTRDETKWALILGAQSAIAQAFCRRLASRGFGFVIVGRNAPRLEAIANDLRVRGSPSVRIEECDLVTEAKRAKEHLTRWGPEAPHGFAVVAICYGTLGLAPLPFSEARDVEAVIAGNFGSACSWALAAVEKLDATGRILIIGSVAGDRGRRKNFLYGAAKAGLLPLVQGINHADAQGRIRAVLIKPGLVDTPMTQGMSKDSPLWSKPDDVADVMVRGLSSNREVLYAPWFWRPLMMFIQLLPRRLFQRLNV